MRRLIAAAFALTLSLAGPIARAEEPTAEEGLGLAEANCTACHAIGKEGASPLPAAPPFREIADRYTQEELMDGFMEGLAVSHETMPDWDMTEDQAIALSLYIMSLAK
ncbi:MAG: cytochrome c [Rhizobiales bacterium]|nr:cytochrome c [Hyphomicrobiales bacterium]